MALPQFFIKSRGDFGAETAERKINGADALHLVTNTHTVPAQNTLTVVANQGSRSGIFMAVQLFRFKADFRYVHILGQFLQFAIIRFAA